MRFRGRSKDMSVIVYKIIIVVVVMLAIACSIDWRS